MFKYWFVPALVLYGIWRYFWKKDKKPTLMDKEDEDESIFSEDMSEFEKASAFISSGKCSLSDAAKLALYGLFKQATCGDNTTPTISAIDVIGSAKWKSWTSYKGLSKEEAESKYVEFVTKLVPQWRESDGAQKVETTETQPTSSSGSFGVSVSKMAVEVDETASNPDDIFTQVAEGNIEAVRAHVTTTPAAINTPDEDGRTLLHWACDKGHLEIVKLLVEGGADWLIKDGDDLCPLDYACICEEHEIIEYLVAQGARLEDCQKDSLEFIS